MLEYLRSLETHTEDTVTKSYGVGMGGDNRNSPAESRTVTTLMVDRATKLGTVQYGGHAPLVLEHLNCGGSKVTCAVAIKYTQDRASPKCKYLLIIVMLMILRV